MKKLFVVLIVSGIVGITSYAQQPIPAVSAQENKEKPKMTKEEKAKAKAQQEEELNALLKETGLDADQKTKVKTILDEAKEKSSVIKKDDSIQGDDKTAKLKTLNDEKNAKLKEIMGDKYKLYTELKKKKKDVNPSPAGQ